MLQALGMATVYTTTPQTIINHRSDYQLGKNNHIGLGMFLRVAFTKFLSGEKFVTL